MSKHISVSLGLISMLAALACSSSGSIEEADSQEDSIGSVESAQVVADAGVDGGNVNDAGVVVADAAP